LEPLALSGINQSPVALTPYQSEERIDDAALGRIIDDAYAAARLHPDDIDAGVVIRKRPAKSLRLASAHATSATPRPCGRTPSKILQRRCLHGCPKIRHAAARVSGPCGDSFPLQTAEKNSGGGGRSGYDRKLRQNHRPWRSLIFDVIQTV